MSRANASLLLAVTLALCCCAPVGVATAQGAKIDARLTPERLGAATTVSLGFALSPRNGHELAPLSAMQLAYPANLGLATSGLGLAYCSPPALEATGSEACPANSRMGSGSATVELPLRIETVKERVSLELFAGPSPDGYLHVLVYASGVFPVYAQVLLSGVLERGQLKIAVPQIPSFPGAPDLVMTEMHLTLGGPLTYYENEGGRLVAYHPSGVGLPSSCPAGGFPFAATFVFVNGDQASARTALPCPGRS